MGADLLPGPRLPRPELDVARYQLVPPVHLALVRQDDLPPPTRRVDGQRLLEALFDFRGPDSLGVLTSGLLVVVKLAGVELCYLGADGLRHSRQSDRVVTLQRAESQTHFSYCNYDTMTPSFVVRKIDHLLKGFVIKTFQL